MAEEIVFKIKDALGKSLSLRKDRYQHILERPEMRNQEKRIKETLKNPDTIKESKPRR